MQHLTLGQSLGSHEAEDRSGGPMEASFLTPLTFLVFFLFIRQIVVSCIALRPFYGPNV